MREARGCGMDDVLPSRGRRAQMHPLARQIQLGMLLGRAIPVSRLAGAVPLAHQQLVAGEQDASLRVVRPAKPSKVLIADHGLEGSLPRMIKAVAFALALVACSRPARPVDPLMTRLLGLVDEALRRRPDD